MASEDIEALKEEKNRAQKESEELTSDIDTIKQSIRRLRSKAKAGSTPPSLVDEAVAPLESAVTAMEKNLSKLQKYIVDIDSFILQA